MSETSTRFRAVADGFGQRVAAVPADGWDRPSPCEERTARDVVGHVIGAAGMFLGRVGLDIPASRRSRDVADDADDQTRLLGFTGRRV